MVFVSMVFLVQETLLKPAEMNASLRKSCLPGTRKRLIAEIINWATQGDIEMEGNNILWLHGMAGSGKSTIATTIARHFGTLGRQGAYIFFERATGKPYTHRYGSPSHTIIEHKTLEASCS